MAAVPNCFGGDTRGVVAGQRMLDGSTFRLVFKDRKKGADTEAYAIGISARGGLIPARHGWKFRRSAWCLVRRRNRRRRNGTMERLGLGAVRVKVLLGSVGGAFHVLFDSLSIVQYLAVVIIHVLIYLASKPFTIRLVGWLNTNTYGII
jgi:hypothetical protein